MLAPRTLETRVKYLEDTLAETVALVSGNQATLDHAADTVNIINTKLDTAMDAINRLTLIEDRVTSTVSFVQKYGFKAVIFGAGVMSSLGVGNPHLWDFIKFLTGR